MALDRIMSYRVLREPHRLVEARQQYADDLMLQLEKGWQNSLQERTGRVDQAARALVTLNPLVCGLGRMCTRYTIGWKQPYGRI